MLIRLLVLGATGLDLDGAPRFGAERSCQLLAYLALQDGAWVARERLAALLWPERSAADGRRNLRKVVFRAHAMTGVSGLEVDDRALRWSPQSDLRDFTLAVAAGRHGEALELLRGPLLEGLDDDANPAWSAWLNVERTRVAAVWRQAALDRIAELGDDPAAVVVLARSLLRSDPLDEAALAVLLRAELACGHPALAQRAFREYATRLAEDLGVDPSASLRAILAGAAAEGSDARRFIGRRSELRELVALLAEPGLRWLTLLGPGGIGKSRLARELIATPIVPTRRLWIDLQDLADVDAMLGRLAERAGVDPRGTGDLFVATAAALAATPVLLVLDNAEHLDGLAPAVERLLAAATGLRVVVTSRASVGGGNGAERVWRLGGLAVPDDDSRDADAALAFDAVGLFVARAGIARRGFDAAAEIDAIVDIVAAVDGMPLAIELAASWIRLLPASEIALELRTSIDALALDPKAVPAAARPEHASVREVLERSWRWLAPSEKAALAGLAVFRGSFGVGAARAVAAVSLPLLSALVDKSLVAAHDDARFALHPLVAAYALEQLEATPERRDELAERHAAHFAAELRSLAPHARGDARRLVAGIAADFANVRAAWLHALGRADRSRLDAMASTLAAYYEVGGRAAEGLALLTPALPLADGVFGQRLRCQLSSLHVLHGDLQTALALARAGIAAGEAGEPEAFVGCLLHAGSCLWQGGDHAGAQALYEQALAAARRHGSGHSITLALGELGTGAMALGDLDAAWRQTQEALGLAREAGNAYLTAGFLSNLGGLARLRGDLPASEQLLAESVARCDEAGLATMAQYALQQRAQTLAALGRRPEARRQFEAVLERTRASGMVKLQLAAERELARLDLADGAPAEALARLRRIVATARATGHSTDLAKAAVVFGEVLAAAGDVTRASRIWQMVLAQQDQEAGVHRHMTSRLESLPAVSGPPPSLDEVLGDLLSHAGAPAA